MPFEAGNLPLFAVIGSLIAMGFIGIFASVLHSRRERSLLHAERMKAMELGRDVPEDAWTTKMRVALKPEPPKSLAGSCFTTTGWVAGLGLLIASQTSGPGGDRGVAYLIAGAAGAIGVTGMICGTILASKAPDRASIALKPGVEPEVA